MNNEPSTIVGFLNTLLYWVTATVLPVSWSLKLAKVLNSDWDSVNFSSLKSGDLTPKRGWNENSQASKDLRAGLEK